MWYRAGVLGAAWKFHRYTMILSLIALSVVLELFLSTVPVMS